MKLSFVVAGSLLLSGAAHAQQGPPLAPRTLETLAFAGYDYRFEYGQGFHSTGHGRAILPDSLRWLWRDWREASH